MAISEKKKAYLKIYRKNNPEKYRESSKKYREANREEVRLKQRLYNKTFKINNPTKVKESKWKSNFKRRNIISNSLGNHTFDEWNKLIKKCQYRCVCCLKKEPAIKLTRDHIIPLSKGGDDIIDNIQPLCQSCNSTKKDKTINYLSSNISLSKVLILSL